MLQIFLHEYNSVSIDIALCIGVGFKIQTANTPLIYFKGQILITKLVDKMQIF
jgi:hypothetical protein